MQLIEFLIKKKGSNSLHNYYFYLSEKLSEKYIFFYSTVSVIQRSLILRWQWAWLRSVNDIAESYPQCQWYCDIFANANICAKSKLYLKILKHMNQGFRWIRIMKQTIGLNSTWHCPISKKDEPRGGKK